MIEHPILFSGPMVQAILEGRKTMTRRVLAPTGAGNAFIFNSPAFSRYKYSKMWHDLSNKYYAYFETGPVAGSKYGFAEIFECPYGQPGGRLWVRETFAINVGAEPGESIYAYKADGDRPARWKPSIHMPRAACRILLEVTEVRVERLQDIGQMDVVNEGMTMLTKDGGRVYKFGMADRDGLPGTDNYGWEWQDWNADHGKAFARLWDSINAARGFGWDSNPWVWVVSFKRISNGN